jgi:aminoglycoside 3-N-acetyltransferase
MVTKSDVFKMLEEFHVKHDDKIIVHSALRSVGEIEGGADGLIDAFCEYLSEGLLLIPTHSWRDVKPVYDVKTTPTCLGALSKVALERKDGIRTLHPTHSIKIFGKNAAEYAEGEEKFSTVAPAESCLGRLYDEHGKILLIGVGNDRNTFLHTIDERLNIPNRLSKKPITVSVKGYDGEIKTVVSLHTHVVEGVPEGCHTYYPNYDKALKYCGAVQTGYLGNAFVYCYDAFKTTNVVKMLWEKADYDLCASGREIPEEYYSGL